MNSLIKRLHSNLLLAANTNQTLNFYEKLGFDASMTEGTVRVKLGDFTLAFIDENKVTIADESGKLPKGTGIYTYIEVTDVDQYYEYVKEKGIVPRTEPKTWPWGKREFVVKDPDGYKLVFYSTAQYYLWSFIFYAILSLSTSYFYDQE